MMNIVSFLFIELMDATEMESDEWMRNWKRKSASVAVLFVLLLAFLVPNAAANTDLVRYLALGDSLAAGVTPTKGIDKGYADYAAGYLQGEKMLESFTKDFSMPGDRTDELLTKLTTSAQLQAAVQKANTITISAGANDLLKESKVDPVKKVLIIDETKVPATLQKTALNYTLILQTINKLNPDAKVYVVGYYFPFPYIADEQKPKLIQLTQTLNKTIELASVAQGAKFVSIYEKFGNDPKKYLPNPLDIHPNAEGYKVISEALLASFAEAQVAAKDVPAGHWAEKELKLLLASKVFKLDDQGNVYPDRAITRAEVANILFGLLPMTTSVPADPGYEDVPVTHPSYMAIAKLTEAGIFAKSTSFNPDAPLTRVQLAKVVSLAFDLEGDGTTPVYKDINEKYWATPYISAMASNKIMHGYSNGTFGLHKETNRAQFAVILFRIQAQLTAQ